MMSQWRRPDLEGDVGVLVHAEYLRLVDDGQSVDVIAVTLDLVRLRCIVDTCDIFVYLTCIITCSDILHRSNCTIKAQLKTSFGLHSTCTKYIIQARSGADQANTGR